MVSKLLEDGTVSPDTERNIQLEIMTNGSVSFVVEMFEDFHKYTTGVLKALGLNDLSHQSLLSLACCKVNGNLRTDSAYPLKVFTSTTRRPATERAIMP
jgi:Papain family cysteine protease